MFLTLLFAPRTDFNKLGIYKYTFKYKVSYLADYGLILINQVWLNIGLTKQLVL